VEPDTEVGTDADAAVATPNVAARATSTAAMIFPRRFMSFPSGDRCDPSG
jgi:hypothetical protein